MKHLKTTLILLLISAAAFAQKPNQAKHQREKEKIKAMKIAFITDKLALTSEEAQVFWPVYNEYSSKKEALRKKMKLGKKEKNAESDLSDEEITKRINQRFNIRQQQLDLDKAYNSKFMAVLPVKKVGNLYRAEHEFKRELLRKIKNHPNGGKKGEQSPPPPPSH